MALINTIREKSGVAVGAVAVGMLLFIVGGDLIGGKNRLFNRNTNVVGVVNGQKIELPEFTASLEKEKQNFANERGQQPNEQDTNYLRDKVWNQLLFKYAYQPEIDKLGLSVSDAELVDMVQGDNISPAIKQSFTDPKTGQFDKTRVIEYLRKLPQQSPEAQAAYYNFEDALRNVERPIGKYNALLNNSVYVTTAEVKAFDVAQNSKASFHYLFVPYTSVSDSTVKPTDDQLRDYLERHRGKYKVEDGRSIEYIVVPETASAQDSADLRKSMAELNEKFRTSTNDSVFVRANSEQPYSNAYVTAAQLPAPLTKQMPLAVGQVVGPAVDNGTLKLYKVTGEKPRPMVRASHILFKSDAKMTPAAQDSVKKKAEDVLTKLKGGADFAELAKKYSQDTGSGAKGGDLDFFDRKTMVPEFGKAAFEAPGLGLLPTLVKTSYGYHIIKVTGKKTEDTYQVAAVAKNIQPSQATTDAAYNTAEQLAADATSLDAFRQLPTKNKTLQKQEAKFVARDATTLNNLPNSREIVRWAFGVGPEGETKVGDVRKFDIGDQHIIAALTDTRSKGTATIESMRPELTAAVRNELKAKVIMAKLQGKTGNFNDLAKVAGPGAVTQMAESVTLAQSSIPNVGFEPDAVGRAFALKQGQKSAPIQGEQGVLVVEAAGITPNTTPGDVKAIRQQLTQQRQQRQSSQVFQAIKAHANVEDNRSKFF
ncbi:MAG: SurA N-terminal domain-containing protein [Janthinobacterium lividum]